MRTFVEPFTPLSQQERRRSCEGAMAEARKLAGDIWIFGYGSLLWDAPFSHQEARPVRLLGWQRSMCVWTALARGTPERPGLSLGLRRGGACDGIALRIAEADLEAAWPAIWEREMWTDIYQPTWISLDVDGLNATALTFTVNEASRQFARGLDLDQTIAHIALAHGERGPCRDYLVNTVEKLRAMGIADSYLEGLQDAVAGYPVRADMP